MIGILLIAASLLALYSIFEDYIKDIINWADALVKISETLKATLFLKKVGNKGNK